MSTIAFEITPDWRAPIADPPTSRPLSRAPAFRRGEAAVVLLGATALGVTLGFIAALIVGRSGSAAVQASVWIAFGFNVLWACNILVQLVRQRAWAPISLYALHLFAYTAWPFTILLCSPDGLNFWLGLAGLVGTLLAFLIWSGKRTLRLVFHASGLAILISGATSLQAMMITFCT